MYPYINVYNLQIPVYLIMAVLGFICSCELYIFLLHKKKQKVYISVIGLSSCGMIIMAKLFGILTYLLNQLANGEQITVKGAFEQSGIVYFGGLLGFCIWYLFACKINNIKLIDTSDEMAICIPLFHVFGRIGCFFAGCCYGIEYHGIGAVLYNNGSDITYRLPVQLIEAVFELVLFCMMICLYTKHIKMHKNYYLMLYFECYAVFRFFMEFIRADVNRGKYGVFTFSQYVCICLIIFVNLYYFVFNKNVVRR